MTPDAEIDRIREAVPLASVVSEYVKLRKTGVAMVGLCPFHREKTPSFSVSPVKNLYHCHGCGQGGDVITFVRMIEGVSFYKALEILAERAGITLERVQEETVLERKRRLADTEAAELWRVRLIQALSTEFHRVAKLLRSGDALHERTLVWARANHTRQGFDQTRGYERAWGIWWAAGALEGKLDRLDAAVDAIRGARQRDILAAFRELHQERQREIRADVRHCDEVALTIVAAITVAQERERKK